jgi:hypothetical protein
MAGAAKTAAQRKIFRSTTSARAAGWEMMPKKTLLRSAQVAIERDIFIAKRHRASRKSDRPTE